MIEILLDVVGKNTNGDTCHPYKYQRGPMTGMYVYTLNGNDNFEATDEEGLRNMIESGQFNHTGRIRMIPHNATSTAAASAINVVSYKRISLT